MLTKHELKCRTVVSMSIVPDHSPTDELLRRTTALQRNDKLFFSNNITLLESDCPEIVNCQTKKTKLRALALITSGQGDI